MPVRFFHRHKHIILYGLALALLLFLLKWLEWRFIIFDHAIEIYSGALAILFTALGIWLALKLARPKVATVIVEKEVIVTREVTATTAAGTSAAGTLSPALAAATTAAGAALAADPAAVEKALARLGLSLREREVLQLMAEGLSNQEIASRLFVSLNTIKTHSSKIFEKLDVRRRTQAVEMARRLNIIV